MSSGDLRFRGAPQGCPDTAGGMMSGVSGVMDADNVCVKKENNDETELFNQDVSAAPALAGSLLLRAGRP